MKREKILIISQVIYPNRSPRSHRATELAKEFARMGYDVTLCAVLGDYNYGEFEGETNIHVDNLGVSVFESTTSDTSNRDIPILYKRINKLLGKWILFPDCLIGLRVRKYLKKAPRFDRIITIAVPYPIHWGAGYARRHYEKVKDAIWISDCGDPFMGNPFTKRPFYFKWIEKKWCNSTDYITVPIPEAIKGYYEEFRHKIRVIPQGFCFEEVKLEKYMPNEVPVFAYAGTVYPEKRDPSKLLDYLVESNSDFRFIVYTGSFGIFNKYKEKLGKKLIVNSYIPRLELLKELSKVDFLINIQNGSAVQSPSKLIDYYLTRRPIINISSSFEEKDAFEEFFNGNYCHQYVLDNPEQYNIKNVALSFLKLE